MASPRARQDSAGESVLLAALQGVQGSITSLDQRMQASVAKLEEEVSEQGETLAKLSASWKDKAVTQIGAIALAALSIIGAQRALAPEPQPDRVTVHRDELSIRAEGCAKMANGSDPVYAQCMVREVVLPNSPGAKEAAGNR
jgi:hypothetical protein